MGRAWGLDRQPGHVEQLSTVFGAVLDAELVSEIRLEERRRLRRRVQTHLGRRVVHRRDVPATLGIAQPREPPRPLHNVK